MLPVPVPDIVKVERVDGFKIGNRSLKVGEVNILVQLALVQQV